MKHRTVFFRQHIINVTIDPTMPITGFALTVDTTLLRNKIAPTYWRPFSAYHQSDAMKADLEIKERETTNPNEYYYYLHYMLHSPNAPKCYGLDIRVNNLLYLFHDLLHAESDVIGDTMSVAPETELLRLEQAIEESAKQGLPKFPDKLLEKINKMYIFGNGGEEKSPKINLQLTQLAHEYTRRSMS
tara:strand:- start:21807 stop:22367 length:561 start_codon:yes stop_codon:yes gene_type:complete